MDFTQPGLPQMCAVIKGRTQATSMSFHEGGEHLFVASEGDSRLHIIDCQKGSVSDQQPYGIKCQREGIQLVEATHHSQCVLIAGKGSRDQPLTQRSAVHYLSIADNKILRKFRGHSGDVTGISMSPVDDCFLTSSNDRTVRLWNVQQAGCIAQMDLPPDAKGEPHAVFDSTGLVFGISATMANGGGHYVHLYDARNYSIGAFAELKVDQTAIAKVMEAKMRVPAPQAAELSKAEWTSLAFNAKGDQLLATGSPGLTLVLDGFEGTVQHAFCDVANWTTPTSKAYTAACFSPDDETVFCGNQDGTIGCWNAKTGALVKKLEGHTDRVTCVAANPKFAQLASACTNTALWLW